MCDEAPHCACTVERRKEATRAHIQRQDALTAMWWRLRNAGALTEAEDDLLQLQIHREWDDAIHIAAPGDPLRSLCGQLGRNLVDLPERPDAWGGCWTCLMRADALVKADERELVTA